MTAVEVRPADDSDVEAMAAIYVNAARAGWAHIFDEPSLKAIGPPVDRLRAELASTGSRQQLLVAEREGRVIGFAVVRPSRDEDADSVLDLFRRRQHLVAKRRQLRAERIEAGRREVDAARRKQIYATIQQKLAEDLPYIDLWYLDNVVVHSRRTRNFAISPAGNYDFLTTVELRQ